MLKVANLLLFIITYYFLNYLSLLETPRLDVEGGKLEQIETTSVFQLHHLEHFFVKKALTLSYQENEKIQIKRESIPKNLVHEAMLPGHLQHIGQKFFVIFHLQPI